MLKERKSESDPLWVINLTPSEQLFSYIISGQPTFWGGNDALL
jgi:hypothetical protein